MEPDHKNHNHTAACTYCSPKSDGPILMPNAKTKITSFLGVCGCISCYVAMFPAILLGVIGVLGLSQSSTTSALNAYMDSVLFQPILIVSIIFLVAGIFRYGKLPLWLSILGGIGIFISMSFYMQEWLFTLSFAFLALAYFFALRRTKAPQLKFAFILLAAVVIFGLIDIGRTFATKNSTPSQTQPQSTNSNSMDIMNVR